MERLTMTDAEMEEIRQYSPDFDCPIKAEEDSTTLRFCDHVCDEFQHNCPFMNMGHRLKAYEDAEEQGLLLKLPIPIGYTAYYLHEYRKDINPITILDYLINSHGIEEIGCYGGGFTPIRFCVDDIGKTIFLTKEEAEQALKHTENAR